MGMVGLFIFWSGVDVSISGWILVGRASDCLSHLLHLDVFPWIFGALLPRYAPSNIFSLRRIEQQLFPFVIQNIVSS
jgi:hypothetical protein